MNREFKTWKHEVIKKKSEEGCKLIECAWGGEWRSCDDDCDENCFSNCERKEYLYCFFDCNGRIEKELAGIEREEYRGFNPFCCDSNCDNN